jgi:hypothetical protein
MRVNIAASEGAWQLLTAVESISDGMIYFVGSSRSATAEGGQNLFLNLKVTRTLSLL